MSNIAAGTSHRSAKTNAGRSHCFQCLLLFGTISMPLFGMIHPTKSDIQSAPRGIMIFVTNVSEHSKRLCPKIFNQFKLPVMDSTHSVISTEAIAVTISTL